MNYATTHLLKMFFFKRIQFKHLFFTSLLLLSLAVNGQITVQIGTGIEIPANTLYSPCYRFSATSTTTACRSNIVFTAAEMAAAGISAGATITAVEFNKTNSANFVTPASHTMWMANTSNTTLATTLTWASVLGTHTQVYTNASFNLPLNPGWVTWNVTPFVYTGGSLEIATEHTMVGNGGATDAFKWEYSLGVTDKIVAVASLGATLNGTVAAYKHRPNIRITCILPPCTSPPTPGTSVSDAVGTICPGTNVNLGLSGNSAGSGQTYQWQGSSAIGGPYVSFGSPATIPGASVSPTVSTYYRAEVTCSGNTQHSTPVLVSVATPFPAGTYTINSALPTGGSNFQTFTAAASAISCGITGSVVFNVAPGSGPYNEQLILPAIPGTSATKTITFNGNGRTIQFSPALSDERAVIKLNGTDFVTIDSLLIDASAGTYGFGVQLLNNADYNTIKRCQIFSNTTSTSTTNYAGILINSIATSIITAGTSLCDSNLITGNTITGGYAGVAIVANGSTSSVSENKVTKNNIRDFYLYGVYLNGGVSTLIEENDLSRPLRTSVGGFNGIYLTGVSTKTLISKNRLHDPFTGEPAETAGAYGIYITGCDATAGNENVVSNNIVYNFLGGTGSQNGSLNVGSDYVKYYYNTFYLNDVAATCACAARGFYMQTPLALGLEFVNNIVHLSREGTGDKQAIYFEVTGTVFTANHNVYHISSVGGTIQTGFVNGAGQATMALWQTASGQDANSVADNPLLNIAGGNVIPSALAADNIGTPVSITTDILNVVRNAVNPDPGAYEFTAPCPIPSAPVVSNIKVISADINWAKVQGAVGYQYLLSTSATPPASGTPTVDTFYYPNALTAATVYYMHLRTNCGSGNFSSWVTVSFTTEPCAAPVVASSNITASSADITWDVIVDAGGYEYEVSTNVAPPASGTATTDTFYNAGALNTSTTYYAHVRTNCGGGNYSPWTTISFTTDECAAPTAVVSNITGFTADIAWNTVPEASNGYEYELSLSATPSASGTTTTDTTHNPTGLTMNTPYFFHVRSFCGADTSDWSTAQFLTLDVTGVREVTEGKIMAYPNPVKDILTVVISEPAGQDRHIVLTDITGKILHSMTVKANKVEIDMHGLNSGVYFLSYKSDKSQSTIRIFRE